MSAPPDFRLVRRLVHISGIVQGVGFRPAVHRLAQRHHVTGTVRNCGGAVEVELQGPEFLVHNFVSRLRDEMPPPARVDRISVRELAPREEAGFTIAESAAEGGTAVAVAPDVATCEDCLAEVDDRASRWFGYSFTSCTACGPRFTILTAAPFDRARTTMNAFPLCSSCRAEYESPSSRRFHAQTIACPACGPSIVFHRSPGERVIAADPIGQAANWIAQGQIGALKGLGGFHLCCDATNAIAVEELRRRKGRDQKPLAIMVSSLAGVAGLCHSTPEEQRWLVSAARPIVLLRHRSDHGLAPGVSPGLAHTGVMLPYTPLHHLLLRAVRGIPLVMTSGNASDEPTAIRDDAASGRLAGIADFFLTHDREIISRCDDSVVRLAGTQPILIRRSRGYAPAPLAMPFDSAMPTLAAGAHLKTTFALGEANRAIVSHHIGDLDEYETLVDYEQTIASYERLFRVKPGLLAHDLHPDYASTRYALARARRESLPVCAVQHHHAHFASCLVDNGELGPAIGVCFDGTGYGLDGAIWGGEFLVGDCRHFGRAAHLEYVAMPGGEKAIREPWRMALAYLQRAGLPSEESLHAIPRPQLRIIGQMIEQGINVSQTSSAGRFFDAMAALLGVRNTVAYEGQAAMELEALAAGTDADAAYEFGISNTEPAVLDLSPVVRGVVADLHGRADKAAVARRIHATLALLIENVCGRLANRFGLETVALSGGVFMNAILLEQTRSRLAKAGLHVLLHTRVPPNDGGISLGQLAVAAAQQS